MAGRGGNRPHWLLAGHGTDARARKHYREGEKPCEACRIAANAAVKLRKTARPTVAREIRQWARDTGRPVRDTGALPLWVVRDYWRSRLSSAATTTDSQDQPTTVAM